MVVNTKFLAIAAALVLGGSALQNLKAASTCTGTVIEYKASGQFGANPISGSDKFKLAGEPYSIQLYACTTAKPTKTGSDWAEYYPIELTGDVKSAELQTPTPIKPTPSALILTVPASGADSAEIIASPVIEGGTFSIKATIALAAGTFTSTAVAAFPSTSIVTSKSEFTYQLENPAWAPDTAYAVNAEITDGKSDLQEVTVGGTSGSTAPAWNQTVGGTTNDGSVVWTNEGPAVTGLTVFGTASGTVYVPTVSEDILMLHPNAIQVITAHADGSQSVSEMHGAIDPAATTDKTLLQFYASGVHDASDVRVQIAGQDVPVLYSGASDHFSGLDEVTVEVPRSLAGFGDVNVTLTADGRTTAPVKIHIQ